MIFVENIQYSFFPKDMEYKRKMRDSVSQIRNIGRQVIEARMAAIQRGEDVPQDILTYILRGTDNLKGIQDFNLEDMVDEFFTFFGAGQSQNRLLLKRHISYLQNR